MEFERWKRSIEVGNHSMIPGKVQCGLGVSHIVVAHSACKWGWYVAEWLWQGSQKLNEIGYIYKNLNILH